MSKPGVGVDAQGGAVVDPTANVIALNEASIKRVDDLRGLNDRRLDAEIKHTKELIRLRAEHSRDIAGIVQEHSKEIREIESNRLNAIRQVDVLAVNTAADRALAAIQTLAAQTTANADTLRAMVSSTATTIATQTAATVQAITERIAALEKSTYEGKGKSAYSDPMMEQMMQEVRALRVSQSTTTGKTAGFNTSWAILIGAAGLLLTLLGIGGALFAVLGGKS